MSKRYPKNYICIIGLALLFICLSMAFSSPVKAKAGELEVRLNVKSKVLVTDKAYSLKVYNLSDNQTVSFASENPGIATVDENGLVSAISVGQTVITVTVTDDTDAAIQLHCDIIVGPPAISIKLTQPTVVLMDGRKAILKTILQPLNTAESIKFTVLDSSIASVSSGGRITARALGITYILAAIDNGKYDVCQVIVVSEDTYRSLLENPDVDPLTLIPLEGEEIKKEVPAGNITETLPNESDKPKDSSTDSTTSGGSTESVQSTQEAAVTETVNTTKTEIPITAESDM